MNSKAKLEINQRALDLAKYLLEIEKLAVKL